jgi:hypothetical protein
LKRQELLINQTMEAFVLEPSRITPLINFDPDEGILELKGRSSPENSILFYQRLLDYLDEFAISNKTHLVANFAFEYFNTSSSKCLFDLFKRLTAIKQNGKDLTINWFFDEDDEDMMEAGEDYCDLLDLDFNFIEIED